MVEGGGGAEGAEESGEESEGEGEEGEEEGGEGEEGAAAERRVFFVGAGATKEEKRAHKAAVKEAARERRKTKLPKHLKKKSCSSK